MLKILKNLKQSWLSVLTIVALLCVQAAVDLELPNYTSKIVNTGIQAGGIEYAVPETISSKDMEAILLFSNDDDKILENYTTEESDGNYVIKDLKENEKEELKDFSVITFKHKVGDKDMGTIGIIGPKRMDYSKVISVMKYINKKLKDKGI